MTHRHFQLPLLLVLFVVMVSSRHVVARPLMDFGFSAEEVYTDNLLQTKTAEDSWVTSLSPFLRISDQGANTNYAFNYQYRLNQYTSHLKDDSEQHSLDAALNRYAWDKALHFFLTGKVSNTKNQLQSAVDSGITGAEQVQTQSYSTGFNYRSGLRRWHRTSLGASYRLFMADTSADDETIASGYFSTSSGRHFNRFTWSGSANVSRSNRDTETQQYDLEMAVYPRNKLKLFSQGSYELNSSAGTSDTPVDTEYSSAGVGIGYTGKRLNMSIAYNKALNRDKNDFFSGKFSWTPGRKTHLEAEYSRRFFGETYHFDLKHETRRLTNAITYTDTVTSFSRASIVTAFGFLACPEGQTDQPDVCTVTDPQAPLGEGFELVGFQSPFLVVSNDLTVVRSLSHYTSVTLKKSTVTLSSFWTRTRKLQDELQTENVDYVKSLGASLGLSHKTSARTSFNLKSGWSAFDNEASGTAAETYENIFAQAAVVRQLSRKISGSLSYTFDKRTYDDQPEKGYQENRVALSLTANF